MKRKLTISLSVVGCLMLFAVIFATYTTRGQNEANELRESKGSATKMANLEISNNLQKHGIEIIGPFDFRFDTELKRLVGDPDEDLAALIDVAKPLSIIVLNNSKKDVVGCSLKWEMATSKGVSAFPQIQSTPGQLMGSKPVDPNMRGRVSLISTQDVKLFSFDNTIEQIFMNIKNNRGNGRHSAFAYPYQSKDRLNEIKSSIRNTLSSFSHMKVSVDGIFFSDGTFAGTDSLFFFDSMRGRIKAQSDLVALLSTQATSEALSAALSSYIAQNQGKRRRLAPAESPEIAFQQGYTIQKFSLASEITRRRSKFADQNIARDFLNKSKSKTVVLRKLK